MAQLGYNISELVQEAQTRWLKPPEVFFILRNYKEDQITYEIPQKPPSGSLFLLNKRVVRFFRKDGHSWRKKRDGRNVSEAHEKLKVGNIEAINCYYAHGEQNPNFQRRSYWILDPAYEHIVLVHYREINEVRHISASISRLSTGSPSTVSQTPSSTTVQHPASTAVITESNDYQSPGSIEVSSDAIINNYGTNQVGGIGGTGVISNPSELVVSNVLRRLRKKLSINDNCSNEDKLNDQCRLAALPDDLTDLVLLPEPGGSHDFQAIESTSAVDCKDSLSWEEILDFCENSHAAEWEENNLFMLDGNVMLPPNSNGGLMEEQERCLWTNHDAQSSHTSNGFLAHGSDLDRQLMPCPALNSENQFGLPVSMPLTEEEKEENFKFPEYSHGTDPDSFLTVFDHIQFELPLEIDASLIVSQKQKFTIREISPGWGYASEATKVIIVGSFLCEKTEVAWTCMFGDIEVPIQIVQEGVISCQAPPHLPGKVTLCLTSGNQESCSEVREFEYRVRPSTCASCSIREEVSRSPEELRLLVSFAQMLLSDSLWQKRDIADSGKDHVRRLETGEDSWGYVVEALLDGSYSLSSTIDWLLEELLKDKLQQWLSCRTRGCNQQDVFLSKKDKGVIHMVAGLGFVWGLDPILSSGVGINFRDNNGWTALHWAAKFGREKMVAALMASGASAVAVTDPNPQDPIGKTPAVIAATNGHKGLAGYLSEVALISHIESLTLEESELCKDLADVEAETAVNIISRSLPTNDDQFSLKDMLAAVRTSTQAAARIQAAFRAYSFRRRQERKATYAGDGENEYDILANDVLGLSAASKLAFRNKRDYDKAALSIQKKYRGWKSRKDFLAFRKKVVMIQAHVRGHQVRNQYKFICWAVGILEKAVLRWRRKGVGLRGFQPEMQCVDGNEDEDILKAFRKQKVQKAVQEAVSRVLSMVESPDARQQYRRMLDKFRQAKAKRDIAEGKMQSTSQSDAFFMENIP